MTRRDGIARWLAVSRTLFTAIVLLVIAAGIVTQPAFPLGLGPLRTTGRGLGVFITSPWLGRLTTVALPGLSFGRVLGRRRAPAGVGR